MGIFGGSKKNELTKDEKKILKFQGRQEKEHKIMVKESRESRKEAMEIGEENFRAKKRYNAIMTIQKRQRGYRNHWEALNRITDTNKLVKAVLLDIKDEIKKVNKEDSLQKNIFLREKKEIIKDKKTEEEIQKIEEELKNIDFEKQKKGRILIQGIERNQKLVDYDDKQAVIIVSRIVDEIDLLTANLKKQEEKLVFLNEKLTDVEKAFDERDTRKFYELFNNFFRSIFRKEIADLMQLHTQAEQHYNKIYSEINTEVKIEEASEKAAEEVQNSINELLKAA